LAIAASATRKTLLFAAIERTVDVCIACGSCVVALRHHLHVALAKEVILA
jgi:hypothetical protein